MNTFTLCIPTHRVDRPLKRCLDSVSGQLNSTDEVIVVGDTLDGDMPSVAALVESYGPNYLYLPFNGGEHDYGHSQLNYAIAHAQGDWLHCNDDDDVWTPGALDVMREAAAEAVDRPLLFRFLSYHGYVLWEQQGLFVENRIGGHCLVTPNVPSKLGKWTARYQGDWDFILETVNLHGGIENVIWRDEIIAVARPS